MSQTLNIDTGLHLFIQNYISFSAFIRLEYILLENLIWLLMIGFGSHDGLAVLSAWNHSRVNCTYCCSLLETMDEAGCEDTGTKSHEGKDATGRRIDR